MVFSGKKETLKIMSTDFSNFLFHRGLHFNSSLREVEKPVSSNSLVFSCHGVFFSFLQRFLLIYKNNLKQIIKSSFNLSIFSLISLLNREIVSWVSYYSYFFNSIALNKSLDLYLYKLLWQFVKRCHPRRSNTWIYNKYWKRFSSVWRFSVLDTVLGRFYCLKLHTSNFLYYPCLPLSLEIFNVMNFKKFFSLLFKRSYNSFNGIHRLAFIKQKGLCFCCFKPIQDLNCKIVRIRGFVTLNFAILHTYCFL